MNAQSLVLGLTGLAKSGKSTVADHLIQRWGFRREKFAAPLKDMLRAIGLTDAEIEGDKKEVPCDLLCGATPRHAMQTLGTDWGRLLVHQNLWTAAWSRRAGTGLVIADDCRFTNEAAAVRALGGAIIRIERPGLTTGGHASEQEMARIQPDTTILNDGTVNELLAQVDDIVAGLLIQPSPTVTAYAALANSRTAQPAVLGD